MDFTFGRRSVGGIGTTKALARLSTTSERLLKSFAPCVLSSFGARMSHQRIHDQYEISLACGIVTESFGKDPGKICRAMLYHGSRTLRETVQETVSIFVLVSALLTLHSRPDISGIITESQSACSPYPRPAQCRSCNVGGVDQSFPSKRLSTSAAADQSQEVKTQYLQVFYKSGNVQLISPQMKTNVNIIQNLE